MSIEQKINQALQKTPWVKKGIKRAYQLGMYAVSPKIKSEGKLTKLTPEDEYEYFFGYYDKSPWNKDETHILALRAKSTTSGTAPEEPAEVVIIDLNTNQVEVVGNTRAWNVQQGAMLQWLGPDFTSEIIYNDYRNDSYVSVIYNVSNQTERIISTPVYSVSEDGTTALSLDFKRLHRLRPGYGYRWGKDDTASQMAPDSPAIRAINLTNDTTAPLISYQELVSFEPRSEMVGAEHKVNHIMLNPSGDRFMFLHRWINGGKRYTRLLTMNTDGSDLFNLSDDNMASHSYWKNDREILSYLRKESGGNGYYLLTDQSDQFTKVLENLSSEGDGHPSFSPDGQNVVTDTYPNRQRLQSVYIANADDLEQTNKAARVFAPFKYDNDVRCDLHPRWDRLGKKVCIDATFEGKRAMYAIDIADLTN